MTLEKKWIFISLLSTFLWADSHETNSSNDSGIFTTISNFFTQGNTENNSSEDENTLSKSSTIHNDNVSIVEDNETDIFTSIGNFFGKKSNTDTNSSKIVNDSAVKITTDLSHFDGAWHLRVLDGMEVRKARAILDFTFTDNKAKLSGFDGCNRIGGNIQKSEKDKLIIPSLISTKMACRTKIHRWVSKRLHQVFGESFTLKEERKYAIDGIIIKSSKHELFFKKMKRK